MVLVDFPELCDAVVAVEPAVPFDVRLNEIATVGKILNGREVFKGELFDFEWSLVVHG